MTRILFTGVCGILGKYFCDLVPDNVLVYGSYIHKRPKTFKSNVKYVNLDITNKTRCQSVVDKVKPDIIIHAAGISDIDRCEQDKRSAYKTNYVGTKNLVDCTEGTNIRFIFVSTSNVFSGNDISYIENSDRKPVNYYGLTKKISEDYIIDRCNRYTILRSTTIYGWGNNGKRQNIATILLDKVAHDEKILMVNNRKTNFVYAKSVAQLLLNIVNIDVGNKIFHVGGNENISYYNFALILKKVFKQNKMRLEKFDGYYSNNEATRPRCLYLKTKESKSYLNYKPTSVKAGLMNMFEETSLHKQP